MTDDEKLEALRTELTRQDLELESAMEALEALGGESGSTMLPFSPEWLRDLDEACEARTPLGSFQPLVVGIRA